MPKRGKLERLAGALLVLVCAGFLFGIATLAPRNQSPGNPDSKTTLHLARNLVNGKGLVSLSVCQHVVPLPIPHPPVHRKPGTPLIVAGLYTLMGESFAVPVVMNAAFLLIALLLTVSAMGVAGIGWFRYVAGVLLLVSPNYELISAVSNNALMACAAGLLLVGALRLQRSLDDAQFVLWTSLIGAAGFILKPTFIVTAFPFVCLLLGGPVLGRLREWWRPALLALAMLAAVAALTSPYWLPNVLHYGTPIVSVQPPLRLAERYGGWLHGTFQSVRYGEPVTFAEMLDAHGWAGIVSREVNMWAYAVKSVVRQNPYVFALALVGGLVAVSRRNWLWFAMALATGFSDFVFTAFYWAVEDRYLWPLYPGMLFLAGLAVRDAPARLVSRESRETNRRLAWVAALVVALALAYGARYAAHAWTRAFAEAAQPEPEWLAAVDRIPKDAVVLTTDPWSLALVGDRKAVIIPRGGREDLRAVMRMYRPDYVLDTAHSIGSYAFNVKRELEAVLLSDESASVPWGLYRILDPELTAPAPRRLAEGERRE